MKKSVLSRGAWVAVFAGLISVSPAGWILGSEAIPNWAAPASWSPAKAYGGVSAMDVTNPLPFIGLAPCRIMDTRGGAPITGGIFTGGSDVRNVTIPPNCGVPAGVSAVSLNFTVTGPGQTAAGFLLAWPTGGAVPPVSILNWDHVPAQVANAAVVPTNGSGSITLNVSSPTHVIMDINGYYAKAPANTANTFEIINSSGWAILGKTTSSGFLSRGVFGQASATTGNTVGVFGETDSATDGARGVVGYAPAATGKIYGVAGVIGSTSPDAAGVYGVDGSGDPRISFSNLLSAGVRGASTSNIGVWGISRSNTAVSGLHVDSSGNQATRGDLGFDSTFGVFAVGQIGATGAKPFIEPHPTDATKEIAYVALEGPEAGTYFRGRGRIHNGTGVIEVPESFRLVSDEDGLTIQITPIGLVANVAVVSADLNSIAIRSSVRDLEFYYVVNGVRKAFKDWEVITENRHYVPEGPEARMPGAFSPEQRRRLIATGIYNEDGTVNLETAERLGWAKAWRDREEQAKAAAAAYRTALNGKGESK
jgi:hypothetical protein